jgi:hypothetical protein
MTDTPNRTQPRGDLDLNKGYGYPCCVTAIDRTSVERQLALLRIAPLRRRDQGSFFALGADREGGTHHLRCVCACQTFAGEGSRPGPARASQRRQGTMAAESSMEVYALEPAAVRHCPAREASFAAAEGSLVGAYIGVLLPGVECAAQAIQVGRRPQAGL